MNHIIALLNRILKKHKKLKKWQRVVTVLAAVITFITTYALILPAITVEKDKTDQVAGMYVEEVSENVGEGEDMLDENALIPTPFIIAADQENAVTYSYEDADLFAELIISTEEEIPEGTELVVNYIDPESDDYYALSSRAMDLLGREFIHEMSTCAFYDFALICDNVDVTPETGLADIRIFFHNNTVEHTDDALFLGKFARPLDDEEGLLLVSADETGTEDSLTYESEDGDSADAATTTDVLLSVNGDETSVLELSEGIITSLNLKGCDLARDDSMVGILAGFVDEESKAAAEEAEMELTASEDVEGSEDLSDAEQPEKAGGTLTASGNDYTVKLTYDRTSGVPEGAELSVSEIARDSEEYSAYLEETEKAMGLTEEETLPQYAARFFDIKIMVDGAEFTPESGVTVEIAYSEPLAANPDTEVSAVHFQNETSEPEVIDASATKVAKDGTATVEFQTESFSVYGIVYTVDFHYEVDGKEYEYDLPGGSFVSFGKLLEVLGIEDKLRLADVENVAFSSPDLVWVGKIYENTTIGEIKEEKGLEVQYSADLTGEQIDKINGTKVQAGDWALITMLPFTSEESLTVTMKNGDQFVIRVTDAQLKKTVISASGGTYELTVEYGAEAQIPEGADLKVEEIGREDERFAEYLDKALKAVGGEAAAYLAEEAASDITLSQVNYARFFDITIIYKGSEIEPQAEVSVSMRLLDAPEKQQMKVVHFGDKDANVITAEQTNTVSGAKAGSGARLSFVTDGFSVYGVVTAPAPSGVNNLDGRTFKISRGNNYLTDDAATNMSNSNGTNGLAKTTSSASAAVWVFDQIGTTNTYRIYTVDAETGEPKYMRFSPNGAANNDRAHVELTGEDEASAITVEQVNGGYRFSTVINVNNNNITYYLDEHDGANGPGFAGWHESNQYTNDTLTLTFTQPPVVSGQSYMTLVKYNDKYYIVNNDATLTEVPYIESTQQVYVEDPMEWVVEMSSNNQSNGHIYYNHKETGFDQNQLASDYFRMYLDPTDNESLLEETSENVDVQHINWHDIPNSNPREQYEETRIRSRSGVLSDTTLNIAPVTGTNTYTISHDNDNYFGLEIQDGVPVRLIGEQTSDNAAEFVFAQANLSGADWTRHTVSHIDISIAGSAEVSVPLAYGNYYGRDGQEGDPIKVVTSNTKLLLDASNLVDPNQVRITTEDLKRCTITAAREDDGTPLDDAFYITGYSGNVATNLSNNQVRIEGSFKVADMDDTDYPVVDANQYNANWGNNDYRRAVNRTRLENKIEYTVTVIKSLTYNLVDPEVGQLYDEEGKPIQVTVDVAFSASFNYWDDPYGDPKPSNGGNECPPLHNNNYWNNGHTAWQNGEIWQTEGSNSGMDFSLGGDAENTDSPLVALEITKVIQDENGNRIELKTPVYNNFEIYENKTAENIQNPAESIKNSVSGLHVVDDLNRPEWEADPRDDTWIEDEDYELWKEKSIKVDNRGSAIVFDYGASDAMYYIKEDKDSIPTTVIDKDGNEWTYVKTYFETEYVRRDKANSVDGEYKYDEYSNKDLHPNAMHISAESTLEEGSYASIPEVAGNFLMLNGEAKKEGFLEFYCYNVYEKKKGDVSFTKTDQAGHPLAGATYTLFSSYENGVLGNEVKKGQQVVEATSGSDGKVNFTDVPVGTYYMQETAAPSGYQKSDQVYLVVIEDSEGTNESVVTLLDGTPIEENSIVDDNAQNGTVDFKKVDSQNANVAGAKFTLYRTKSCAAGMELIVDDALITGVSDSSGNVTIPGTQIVDENDGVTVLENAVNDIPPGNYYMKETSSPSGYVDNATKYFVHIGTGDPDTSFIAELEASPSLNGSTETEYYRNKAKAQVVNYRENELVIRKKWEDFYGNTVNGEVPAINLTLHQWVQDTATVPDYDVTLRFRYTFDGANDWEVRTARGHGEATIQWVWDDDASWLPVERVNVLGLDSSEYRITKGSNDVMTLTIFNVERNMDVIVMVFNDYWNPYDWNHTGFEEISIESGSSENGQPLNITLNSGNDYTKAYTVAGDGLLTSSSTTLPATYNGKECYYTITEDSVPEGYKLDWISTDRVRSGVLTAYNKKTLIDLTVVKQDKWERTKLPGAQFTLTKLDEDKVDAVPLTEDGLTRVLTTGADGVVKFEDLPEGYYEIKETGYPEGYVNTDREVFYIHVSENGIERLVLNNKRKPIRWETASNDDVITYHAGTATVQNAPEGTLNLKKTVLDPDNQGIQKTDGTYRFTVSGPTGSDDQVTRIVEITMTNGQMSAATLTQNGDTTTLGPSGQNVDAWFDSNDGVTITGLLYGNYTVTEERTGNSTSGSDGQYGMVLSEIIVNEETSITNSQSVTLTANDDIDPDLSAEFINELLPTVDVPVSKSWLKDDETLTALAGYTWSVSVVLEEKEVHVSGPEHEEANTTSWKEVSGVPTLTFTNDHNSDNTFDNLPKYRYYSNEGEEDSVYRIVYSLSETAYELKLNGDIISKWDSENGLYEGSVGLYEPIFTHDAGDLTDGSEYADEENPSFYHIVVNNVYEELTVEDYFTGLGITKVWAGGVPDEDAYAVFQLKRLRRKGHQVKGNNGWPEVISDWDNWQEDIMFNTIRNSDDPNNQNLIRLENGNWTKIFADDTLPSFVHSEEVNNNRYVYEYQYYFEEVECNPEGYAASFTVQGAGGASMPVDIDHPLAEGAVVTATNTRQNTTGSLILKKNLQKQWSFTDADTDGTYGFRIVSSAGAANPVDYTVILNMIDGEVNSARIFKDPEDDETYETLEVDDNGAVLIPDLPPGDYTVTENAWSLNEDDYDELMANIAITVDPSDQSSGNSVDVGTQTATVRVAESSTPSVTVTFTNELAYRQADIEIRKVDGETGSAIPGARFRLLKWNGTTYSAYNEAYSAAAGIEEDTTSTPVIPGRFTFSDLTDGEYKVEEVKTPPGYIKVEDNDIYFSIAYGKVTRYDKPVDYTPLDADDPGRQELDSNSTLASISYVQNPNEPKATFTVGNTPGAALPNAGGPGTRMLYFLGILLAGIAGVGLMLRKRRRTT